MYIKKDSRNKLIIIALVVFAFLYWRGTKAINKERGLNCEYHLVYAVCNAKGKAGKVPTLMEALKAGARF